MFNTVGQQMDLRMFFTRTSVTNLVLMPEQHSSQVISPTSSCLKIRQMFISVADGNDEDLTTVENFELGQAPIFSTT